MIDGVDTPAHPTVFMNEKVRHNGKDEPGPAIRVVFPNGKVLEGDRVIINGPSVVIRNPNGNPAITTHHVQAWIEAWCDDVKVVG